MEKLATAKRAAVLRCLIEGNSILSTSRITGVAKNTIVKLLAEAGDACSDFMDKKMVNLPCKVLQMDEIWSFVGCKEARKEFAKGDHPGDVWTWTSLCADTKLIPSWRVGDRSGQTAYAFCADLAKRFSGKLQISTDGHPAYRWAIGAVPLALPAAKPYVLIEPMKCIDIAVRFMTLCLADNRQSKYTIMKTQLLRLCAMLSLAAVSLTALPACSSTGGIDKNQVGQITDLALTYAVASGKITPSDAALVRQAKEIVLPSDPAPVVAPALAPDTSKVPRDVLADTNALDRPAKYQRARATRSPGVRSTLARAVSDEDGDDDELTRKHPMLASLAAPFSASSERQSQR